MPDSLISFVARGWFTDASWGVWIAYFLVVTQLTIFTVTLYLHRSQTHRGVDFHPVLAHAFRLWSWLSTAMVTKQWVAVHRKHHAKCETADDPHSPMIHGIDKVLWEGVDLYRIAARDMDEIEKYGRGTPDDWIERNVYARMPSMGPTLLLLINFFLFGAVGVAIWALQMVWIPFWAAGVVNGLGHWWGYRNFESADTSTNLSPWGVFIGGEELHNNHHAFPSSAKFALRRFEFDIGWAAIRFFAFLRLAKVLRVAPTLDVRANVPIPDSDTIRAVLAHKFHVMSDYFRGVIVPALQEDAARAGASLKAMPRKLRKALGSGGRWLDSDARERMGHWISQAPTVKTVMEYRHRLHEMLENRNGEAMLEALRQWCHEAERSGIRALQDFAARLKGYRLSSAAA
ncbi:MAG TPA: fatty acid desaturase [Dokdonella sp.]|uniref:DesA family fatty acid desaturase n=1 Tax=Dokdonella sp. TaxID=2291710 RepID=UPI0025C1DD61|nr:fatty acid desaturase [Dokdonella sp.]MBX3691545.1 fatty acid desaturase [Dokdonella sp.]MCW5568402.1 fatty acid desaturase [Dokdonella sp.]HNR92125.1 fatty acid desaturase [Dokdonella sp.]